MKLSVSLVLLLAVSSIAAAQSLMRKTSLVVAYCSTKGICNTQALIKYDFENGELVSKEVILDVPTQELRYDLGRNFILDNRYVITSWGDVIDVPNKKLIHKSNGEYVGIDGKRILIKVCRRDVHGLFGFDLSTREYTRLTAPDMCGLGEEALSPDHTKIARFQFVGQKNRKSVPAFTIEEVGKKRVLEGEFKAEGSRGCDFYAVPFVWVDNSRILTQNGNGNLVLLSMDGKVWPSFKLMCEDNGYRPEFSRDDDGRIRYACSSSYWLDVDAGKFGLVTNDIGHGFARDHGAASWTTLYFEGQVIGKIWGSSPHATAGFIALEYAEENQNLGYPKGVKVWNHFKKDWTTIDIAWGARIVGWING